MDATKHVTVVRPFCIEGQRMEVGDQGEVPRLLAVELVNMAKAVYTPEPEPAAAVPQDEQLPELPGPVVEPEPVAPTPTKRSK